MENFERKIQRKRELTLKGKQNQISCSTNI